MADINVLMCGSDLSNGGGVISLTKNYLEYKGWEGISITYVPTHINGSALTKIKYFIRAFLKINNKLKKEQIDIVHLHTCDGGPFYRKSMILKLAHKYNKKVVLHHHTDYTEFFAGLSGIKKYIVKAALRDADLNLVLGENHIKVIKRLVPTADIKVLHNSVKEREKNLYKCDSSIILFIGWFYERKGIYDFLEAIKKIDDKLDSHYKIALLGKGDTEAIRKIHEIGVDNRIAYIGWADEDKKNELFHDGVVNVLPSYREGLPMTILETMSYGIPNIASNISSIPEIIKDGKNGFLVEPGDLKMLSDKILKILADKSLRKTMSESSYKTIHEEFSNNVHMKRIEHVYRGLVGKR